MDYEDKFMPELRQASTVFIFTTKPGHPAEARRLPARFPPPPSPFHAFHAAASLTGLRRMPPRLQMLSLMMPAATLKMPAQIFPYMPRAHAASISLLRDREASMIDRVQWRYIEAPRR